MGFKASLSWFPILPMEEGFSRDFFPPVEVLCSKGEPLQEQAPSFLEIRGRF
jgi:hypothetical protein